ncbi:LppU/SCO3897 family protein [Micromonospora psammae]|uniref:LppU/SCO3897 family protein n=1 Tax=Micromonospora sp. CPCC 205556 TaxID=3122398 RepID=UPI002FEF9766
MSEQVASPPAPQTEQPGPGPEQSGSAATPGQPGADGAEGPEPARADEPAADHGDEPADHGDEPAADDAGEPVGSGARVAAVLGIVAVVVALLVVAGLKFGVGRAVDELLHPDRVGTAKAGDCLTELPEVTGGQERSVRDVAVVTCASGDAVYKVAGRVEDQTEAQARSGKACERYLTPTQDAYVFYSIEPGRTGYLLCLTRKA